MEVRKLTGNRKQTGCRQEANRKSKSLPSPPAFQAPKCPYWQRPSQLGKQNCSVQHPSPRIHQLSMEGGFRAESQWLAWRGHLFTYHACSSAHYELPYDIKTTVSPQQTDANSLHTKEDIRILTPKWRFSEFQQSLYRSLSYVNYHSNSVTLPSEYSEYYLNTAL